MRKFLLFLIFFTFATFSCYAQIDSGKWRAWLREFKQEAIDDGIRPQFFDQVFQSVTPDARTVRFDRQQPEKRITFSKYRETRAGTYRILLGRKAYRQYQPLLKEIGETYHVDPCFIVALWGMESSYGNYMGDFPVIRSLATLAFDNRRRDFFRRELLIALHILQEGHVSMKDFKGEWAGGSGQPQFLPSSWLKYAVDYDKDGRKNIWTSYPDAFASMANYLATNGWRVDEPWGIEVELPDHFNPDLLNEGVQKTVREWQALGVRLKKPVNNSKLLASILLPHGGPPLMTFENFKVIMTYNRSTYYAGTIGQMADQICRRE